MELSSSTSRLSYKELNKFRELVEDDSVNINATDSKDGMNALLKLCRHYEHDNLIELVRPLIKRGIDVTATDPNGENSLHDRSDKGININAKDSIGRNALHLVFQNNNHGHMVQVAKSLIDSGVDVNAQTKTGWSPLHVLFRYYKHDNLMALTEILIKRGGQFNNGNA